MPKFLITAASPIGEKTVEANHFAEEGAFIVFTTPKDQAAIRVYAIAIDKVISIEREPD